MFINKEITIYTKMSQRSSKPLCRSYYKRKLAGANINRCSQGKICKFDHPASISSAHTSDFNRELRRCYCGSELKTIISSQPPIYNQSGEDVSSIFFVVCGRTRKSIKRCRA